MLALASLASEINFLTNRGSVLDPGQRLVLLQVVVAYIAIGFACWLPLVVVPISWAALVVALFSGLPWLPCIAAWVVAVVVAAVMRAAVGLVHVGFYLVWAVPMNVIEVGLDGDRFWWQATLGMLPAALIGVAIRHFVVRHQESWRRVRELEQRNEEIQREERQALARDLHDVVAHQLTLITMQVTSRWRSQDPDELAKSLTVIDEAARSALVELRVLLDVLRDDCSPADEVPPAMAPVGPSGGPSVIRLVERLTDRLDDLGFRVRKAEVDPSAEDLPTLLVITSTRIFQEAVTNIIKHAPSGADCELSLAIADATVQIRVVSDLTNKEPLDPATGRRAGWHRGPDGSPEAKGASGYGLQGMRERVNILGGTSTVGEREGRWEVQTKLPLSPRDCDENRRPTGTDSAPT